MKLRGPVVDVSEPRTVSTSAGDQDLCEVVLRPDRGAAAPVTVTLWGDWAETGDYLSSGMTIAVHEPTERTYRGERQYATGADTTVVVEPEFLVDVTEVREWVQCPRLYYLQKLGGTPLAEPVVTGTIVHEVFGDLLRGRDMEESVEARVTEAGLELGLLGIDRETMASTVRNHATAIEAWLQQGTFSDRDEWRSELTLVSERYGLKGRADAVRREAPVELKTGKNTKREPRFQDKIQAACYALLLGDRSSDTPNTGTLLYTKNATVDRVEASGDLSPAKDFTIGKGLLDFVLRTRNELAAMEYDASVPTGYEGDAICDYCFEQDTCLAVSGRLDQESKAGQIGEPLPDDELSTFEELYVAIERERRAVHREYAKLWEQSAAERATDDRALIDLEPSGQRQLEGGRWELRAAGTGAVSKIREGDLVLASDGDPINGTAEVARVERLSPEIIVTADEPVELRRLDIYPSELFADRSLTALHDAILTQSTAAKDILFERRAPTFQSVEETFEPNNEAQDQAIRRAVGAEDCALVHGPPGTGKTYVLAKIVRALVDRGERVLVSAFTNRAVDNALAAIESQGIEDIVRFGTESGIRDDMLEYRLETAGAPDDCANTLLSAEVVAGTTAACGSRVMREQSFDTAVIDEAAQLTEPATLAAIVLADRFVLVGDDQQLPPVVRDAPRLEQSLFERLHEAYPSATVMLDRQYRMAQRIQAFSSQEFYDGALRPANGTVAGRHLRDLEGVDSDKLPPDLLDRVAFRDPGGSAEGHRNPTEAAAVAEVVETYLEAGLDAGDIGVIAPFRAQVAEISRKVPEAVAVDTVDRFQGSSTEVIVISFVATGDLSEPIFEDHRRVNVALTRAKRALVLVGDTAALSTDPVYRRMLDWAQ
ncbi:MAG: AAA domain-containing protein [Salinirussus sp.]